MLNGNILYVDGFKSVNETGFVLIVNLGYCATVLYIIASEFLGRM